MTEKAEETKNWKQELRRILRNTAPTTVRNWCKSAGINGNQSKTLLAYAEGTSLNDLSLLCGYDVRSITRTRLRALKKLRCYFASFPSECPVFAFFLTKYCHSDGGPLPK